MGGYLPTPGIRLFGETVVERESPDDHDRLRKLRMAVAEMEAHITAQEVAISKTTNEAELNMRKTSVSMTRAKMDIYREEIRELDER